MNAQPQDEFCPRCGQWVDVLDERTGWCTTCAPTIRGGEVCRRCGERRAASWYRDSKHARGICRACRTAQRTKYRHAHADDDRAYTAQRRKRLGKGTCPECGYRKLVTATGVLMAHKPGRYYDPSTPRCTGSGQPPAPNPSRRQT